MNRALVVTQDDDDADLIQEAGRLASGVGGGLVVLYLTDEDAFEKDLQTMDSIESMEKGNWGDPTATEYAASIGRDIAKEALDGIDVEPEITGAVTDGDRATTIVDVAEEYECDHIFLSGQRRSPAGKAVFGDVTQSVLLNAEGYVTVLLE